MQSDKNYSNNADARYILALNKNVKSGMYIRLS
jgi:hypothetical protein